MKMNNTLTEESIIQQLKKTYQPGVVASIDGEAEMFKEGTLKCAAVLLPLIWWQDEWQLVFTRRTDTVEHHKGQVSFPGGGCELGETSPEATALREAQEEIGLNPQEVRLLGRMTDSVIITRFRVTPVVGVLPWPYPLRAEPAEVARIFTIPLLWLADRQNWEVQPFTPPGTQRTFQVLSYHPYDSEVLWGATARMTQDLLTLLGLLGT
jgi:8-oxo-dGTP pyrophosphatase MutT (NUDIX family)